MEFKIDTKPAWTVVTPVSNRIDAALTDALRQKWSELDETGSRNLIIDLHNCLSVESDCLNDLADFHQECYTGGHSLVFTNIPEPVQDALKASDLDSILNIAPTMAEAIDLVNMEILERDLFNEES